MGYWVSWVKRHRPHNHSNETQTRQQTPDTHKLYIAAPTPRHPYPLSNPCRVVVVPQAPPHEVLFRRLGRCPPDCQSPNRNRLQIVYVPLTVHQFRSGVSDGTSLHSTSVFQMEHGCWRHSGLVFQTEHHCTLVRCFKQNTTVLWFGVSNGTQLYSGSVFQTERHCTLVRCFKRNTTVLWFSVSNGTPATVLWSGVSNGTQLYSSSVFQTEHHCTLVRCFKRNTTVHWFGVSNATPLHSYRSLPTMTKAQHLLSSCSHFPAAPLCMQFQFRHKSNDPTDDKKKRPSRARYTGNTD